MNIQKMMKQAQEMQSKIAQMQAKIEAEESEGSSGGGLVALRINGKHELLSVTIDVSLLTPGEKETLEDLILVAFRNAKNAMDESTSGQMKAVTSGLNLPAGMKLPF